jgi:hypothetical protein
LREENEMPSPRIRPEEDDEDSLDTLRGELSIVAGTADDLDTELIRQAQLYGHVGTLYAFAVATRDKKKHDLEVLEAKLDRDVRDQLESDGERVTENKVEAAIKLEPSHQRAYGEYLDARHYADEWEALKDAYRQRSYMLREIVNLRVTDYFGEAVGSSERKEARDRSFRRRYPAHDDRC